MPDPEAKLKYMEYVGARQAEWPEADFIVGNPPYMGGTRMREAFGDGYVEALRRAYPTIREGADFVMFWWARAAREVAEKRAVQAGLITTNSITQSRNRTVVEAETSEHAAVTWAIADHPWVDEAGGAAVRVAMTVIGRPITKATLVEVDDSATPIRSVSTPRLNSDLTAHADVGQASSIPLTAQRGLGSMGFALYGAGFIVEDAEARRLICQDPRHREVVKPYRHGRDLTARPRGVWVIDFALMEESEAQAYPVLYDLVRARVKPARDANKRASVRDYWWRFGWPRPVLREALAELSRYIATPETMKHRFFAFLDESVAPDNMLVCIATEDALHLGVLSSEIHVTWALAAGGRLGVGNDPRYNKTRCFDPFPFPDPPADLRSRIADIAERLDAHRKNALARDERVTMTGMYNVLEKLRSGEALTKREREVHEIAACGVLHDLHEELDRLVAEAYGWPWPMAKEEILERLVALHAERVEEEKRGIIRWLRPEYQRPRFAPVHEAETPPPESTEAAPAAEEVREPWPSGIIEQLTAVRALLGAAALEPEEAAARFEGAPVEVVRGHLELLAGAGEVWQDAEGRYQRAEQGV